MQELRRDQEIRDELPRQIGGAADIRAQRLDQRGGRATIDAEHLAAEKLTSLIIGCDHEQPVGKPAEPDRHGVEAVATGESQHIGVAVVGQRHRLRRCHRQARPVQFTGALLDRLQPHQIYITGDLADPSSVQGMAFAAFCQAMNERSAASWRSQCRVWLYRTHQREFEPHQIEMAVPMSPDQVARKVAAAHKFLTHVLTDNLSGERNRENARLYDKLGMAEYEAIEAFRQWQD